MLIIGLTGGIGSGKSLIEGLFAELGVPIIDADNIARQIVVPGSDALDDIVDAFGEEILNGSGELNRALLRELIFANPLARQRLESILHPRIRSRMKLWTEQQSAMYVMHVVPLLLEKGMESTVDRVLVVDCPEQQQLMRVIKRDGVSTAQVRAIMASQITRDARLARADDVLDNQDDVTSQREAVSLLHAKYLKFGEMQRRSDLPAR